MPNQLLIARNQTTDCHILMGMANRHGLITGATGTGKTVSLQTLAENFSNQGVPVFMADVKGDLTGLSQPGRLGEKLAKVLAERGFDDKSLLEFGEEEQAEQLLQILNSDAEKRKRPVKWRSVEPWRSSLF